MTLYRTSQSSSGSSSSATRIIIPVVVVCGVALAALVRSILTAAPSASSRRNPLVAVLHHSVSRPVLTYLQGILVLFKTRKQRALRAHRRKTSWMASNKYKWQPNQTKPEGAIDETEE